MGQSAGGRTTRINRKVDALEDPLNFIVELGDEQDRPLAARLIEDRACGYFIAD
jgi:hypothetical protein